jgi:hypothetical protein
MPTISMFYGILIRMFFRDVEKHHAPHIHAEYQGQVGVYSIVDGTLLAGELPPNKQKLSSHGSRFIKRNCLPTGIWPSTARSRFLLEGLTNENQRSPATTELGLVYCC